VKKVELEGKKFKISGLKRRDVKRLKRAGINFTRLDDDGLDDVMDQVYECVGIKPEDVDELFYASALQLFNDILKLTFLSEEETKN